MSSSIEKINRIIRDDVKNTKDLKVTLKQNASMFVCEEHVTLWITPKSKMKTQ